MIKDEIFDLVYTLFLFLIFGFLYVFFATELLKYKQQFKFWYSLGISIFCFCISGFCLDLIVDITSKDALKTDEEMKLTIY